MKRTIFFVFAMLLLAVISCKKDNTGLQFGTVTDVEGNVYKTVKIGDQWWMAENLKVEKLNEGTQISNVELESTWSNSLLTDPMMCYYKNDKMQYKDKFGALYNWHAVNTGKLAPAGWHVASNADWQKLNNYLIANGYNYDGSAIDNKIAKSLAATSGWSDDPTLGNVGNDQASNNKSRLNILPGGNREADGTFTTGSMTQTLWTSTMLNSTDAVSIKVVYNNYGLSEGWGPKTKGRPVRCVKD